MWSEKQDLYCKEVKKKKPVNNIKRYYDHLGMRFIQFALGKTYLAILLESFFSFACPDSWGCIFYNPIHCC